MERLRHPTTHPVLTSFSDLLNLALQVTIHWCNNWVKIIKRSFSRSTVSHVVLAALEVWKSLTENERYMMQPKVYVNKVFELGTCYSVSISVNFKDISVTQSATIADSNPEIFRTALEWTRRICTWNSWGLCTSHYRNRQTQNRVPESLTLQSDTKQSARVTNVTIEHKAECASH